MKVPHYLTIHKGVDKVFFVLKTNKGWWTSNEISTGLKLSKQRVQQCLFQLYNSGKIKRRKRESNLPGPEPYEYLVSDTMKKMKNFCLRIEPEIKKALRNLSTVSLSDTVREYITKGITLQQEKGEVYLESDYLSIPISKIRFGGNARLSVYIPEELYTLAKEVFKEDSQNALRRALLVALIGDLK